MEWVVDSDSFDANPLRHAAGRREIRELSAAHAVRIGSVMCDFLMDAPFYRAAPAHDGLDGGFVEILECALELRIPFVIIPLVDGGRLTSPADEDSLIATMNRLAPRLASTSMRILFESDYAPLRLRDLIGRLPGDRFGLNYDIGNSASWGHDPDAEFEAYGRRVLGVHVKDRRLGGTTVAIGTGNADFPRVFRALAGVGYAGDYILQTARAEPGEDVATLCRYREMVREYASDATDRRQR
jgi:hexulose-6-phosphate isomerase